MRSAKVISSLALSGALGAGLVAGLSGTAGAAPATPAPSVTTATFSFTGSLALGAVPPQAATPAGTSLTATGNGVVDFSSHSAALTVTLPAAAF